MQVCRVSASSLLWFLKRIILNIFFENLPFNSPCQPIKLRNLGKNCMEHGGLLNKHFCIKKFQISTMTWKKLRISTFPIIISLSKSMGTISCLSNQSSYPTGIKTHLL